MRSVYGYRKSKWNGINANQPCWCQRQGALRAGGARTQESRTVIGTEDVSVMKQYRGQKRVPSGLGETGIEVSARL